MMLCYSHSFLHASHSSHCFRFVFPSGLINVHQESSRITFILKLIYVFFFQVYLWWCNEISLHTHFINRLTNDTVIVSLIYKRFIWLPIKQGSGGKNDSSRMESFVWCTFTMYFVIFVSARNASKRIQCNIRSLFGFFPCLFRKIRVLDIVPYESRLFLTFSKWVWFFFSWKCIRYRSRIELQQCS